MKGASNAKPRRVPFRYWLRQILASNPGDHCMGAVEPSPESERRAGDTGGGAQLVTALRAVETAKESQS